MKGNEWVFGLDEITSVCDQVNNLLKDNDKVFIVGEMGAGKTTFIKNLVLQRGYTDDVSSPTYSLVNMYQHPTEPKTIHHMDLYRIKQLEEALDFGIEEYLSDDSLCIIEWPEIIEMLSNNDTRRLNLSVLEDNRRKLVFL